MYACADDYDTADGTGVRDYIHVSMLIQLKHVIDKKRRDKILVDLTAHI